MPTTQHKNNAQTLSRERARQIHAEQIGLLYKHTPLVLAGNVALVPVVLSALWGVVAQTILLGWGILVCRTAAARAAPWIAYLWASPVTKSAGRWEVFLVLGGFISGGLWSAAGVWMFVPEVDQPLRADASPEESPQERNFHQTLVRSIAIDQLSR